MGIEEKVMEKIKVPFGTIEITPKAKRLIREILKTKNVSQGKYVGQFEKRFAELVGVKEAVAVSSGADADTIALAVLYDCGAERGDEIIVPALSFVATANAVVHAGFNPVFVDIKRDTYNINPELIEDKITRKTRAIMPVHLMGKPAEMDAILDIAKWHNLYVIEDAAEAHGAKYKGRNAGSMGDMGAFSTYIAHIITTGEGGIITTNNEHFAEAARSLRAHGREGCLCKKCQNIPGEKCHKRFSEEGEDERFYFDRIGYSSKMNEFEAAVGVGALESYDKILSKRRKNLAYLLGNFRRFEPFLRTFYEESHETIGPHAFPILLGEKAPFSRDEYSRFLNDNCADTRDTFASMPTQYKSFINFKGNGYQNKKLGDFPNAEYVGDNGLHIGVHQGLHKKELDHFLSVTERFMKEKGL